MILDSRVTEFVRALSTSSTDSSFPSKIPTTTEPVNDGVIDLLDGATVCNHLLLLPIGTDTNNQTFDLRLIGWRKISTLWIPVPLIQVACTLGNITGVNASAVENEEFFCDTLTLTLGNDDVTVELISPAGASLADIIGHALVDVKGFRKVEPIFDRGTAVTCNCLYAKL